MPTEEADETTVREILEPGTWNCVAKSRPDGAPLVRTIRHTHTALAANDVVDALAGAKNHGQEPWHTIELLVTDVVMPNLANWRRNSLDCIRTKNCCSFLVMPARLGSTIKVGGLETNFLENPNHSGAKFEQP